MNCKANEVLIVIAFGRIIHDEESGSDVDQLNKNELSIIIGLCLMMLSPLAILVYIYFHLALYSCAFIILFFVLSLTKNQFSF